MARAVLGLRDQLDLPGRVDLRIAGQHAALVGGAAAQHAQILQLGAVVVGVEAADDAGAAAQGLRQPTAHLDGLSADRPAARVERDHAKPDRALLAGPRKRLDAQHHGAGPQVDAAGDGLRLAVGIEVAELAVQLGRMGDGRQVLQRQRGRTLGVGEDCELVGDQPVDRRGLGIVVGAVGRLHVTGRREVVALVASELHDARLEQRRDLRRRVGHRPARQVRHLHAQRQFARRDRHLGRCAQTRIDQRHAELLDPETAAEPIGLAALVDAFALQPHVVLTQLGRRRNDPARQRVSRAVPHQRLHHLLAAALVDDLHARGQLALVPWRQTAQGFGAQEVLHRHRFARAQQGAVEHRVRHRIALRVAAGGLVEAPGLDALMPVAEHEGGVDRAAGA